MKADIKQQLFDCKTALVFALPCEAAPIIKSVKATHIISEFGFKLYAADDLAIVITGVGRNAMAAGVAWAKMLTPKLLVWVNVGIAGHQNAGIGTLHLALSVRENNTHKVFYPHLLVKSLAGEKLSFAELMSVDIPLDSYPDQLMMDMEASAFIETARRFARSEAIQVIKIISDNAESDHSNINAAFVEQIIEENCQRILAFVSALNELVIPHTPNQQIMDKVTELETRLRFSVSQRIRLTRLLSVVEDDFNFEQYDNPKLLLKALEQHILKTAPSLITSENNPNG